MQEREEEGEKAKDYLGGETLQQFLGDLLNVTSQGRGSNHRRCVHHNRSVQLVSARLKAHGKYKYPEEK